MTTDPTRTDRRRGDDARRVHFESRYRTDDEPWDYSLRAAEVLRHHFVLEMVRTLAPRRVLDLGSSLGYLTAGLARLPVTTCAMDISPTAVRRTRNRVRAEPRRDERATQLYAAGSALAIPFARGSFDLVVALDGLHSWLLNADERGLVLREAYEIVEPGGHLLLTEHLRPEQFRGFVREAEASPFRIVGVSYLYDRPWYQIESWFKAVHGWRAIRAVRRSLRVARTLSTIGRAFGPVASRHICVLARKEQGQR